MALSRDDLQKLSLLKMTNVRTLFSMGSELVASYEKDALAQTFKVLVASGSNNTVWIDEDGFIVYEGRIYVPIDEAEQVFYDMYKNDSWTDYGDLETRFAIKIYSPMVTGEDMRQWFKAYQSLAVDTNLDEIDISSDEFCVEPPPSAVKDSSDKTSVADGGFSHSTTIIGDLLQYFDESELDDIIHHGIRFG